MTRKSDKLTREHVKNRYVGVGKNRNFDVCPDLCAVRDAAELLRKPPAVIVNLEFPEEVWKFHENAFRKGVLSGQRKIAAAMNQLTGNGRYEAVGRFETPLGYPIKVWARTPTRERWYGY